MLAHLWSWGGNDAEGKLEVSQEKEEEGGPGERLLQPFCSPLGKRGSSAWERVKPAGISNLLTLQQAAVVYTFVRLWSRCAGIHVVTPLQ